MPALEAFTRIERHAWEVMEGAPVNDAVRAMCGALGGVNAVASLVEVSTGQGVAEGFAEMDPDLAALLATEFNTPATNPVLDTIPRMPAGSLYHCAETFDLSRLRRTRFHADWWVPTGVRDHAGAMTMPAQDGRFTYVAIGCLGGRDWFDPDEVRFAEASALTLSRALCAFAGMSHARAEAATEALAPDPCWLVAADGTCFLANEPGRREAESGRVLRTASGALACRDPEVDGRLRAVVAAACVMDGRIDGMGAAVVRVAGGFSQLWVEPGPRYRDTLTALVSLRQARPLEWTRADLSRVYALTPREADVALGLARGMRPDEIAADLRIAAASVRLYLKRIYAKTGAHGQGALIALLLRGR